MPDSSIAIANEFLKRWKPATSPAQMKLQKLVYVAHGWNLAIHDKSLVGDEVPEAWDNGPVFRSLYASVRYRGYFVDHNLKTIQLEDNAVRFLDQSLTKEESDLIDAVWNRYGRFTAQELSDMTHQPGTPWTNAFLTSGQNTPILNRDIKSHYQRLGQAGRDSRQ